ILESGVPLGGGIPTRRHDSLVARLDRPASARRVAQIGSAAGREFSHELTSAVARCAACHLQAALAPLLLAELVFERGTPPDAVYSFKHALVQDAAHGSLLRSDRQQLHAQIAASLEEHFPDRIHREPEVVARHFSEAQQPDRALGYWLQAGR